MIMVHRITEAQAQTLETRRFSKDSWFNPEQDADGLWFISVEEVRQCTVSGLSWVKTLPLVPYNPKPVDMSMFGIKP